MVNKGNSALGWKSLQANPQAFPLIHWLNTVISLMWHLRQQHRTPNWPALCISPIVYTEHTFFPKDPETFTVRHAYCKKLFLSTSSLINRCTRFTTTSAKHCRRFRSVCVSRFAFPFNSNFLLNTKFVYFSLRVLIIRSIYFFIPYTQCLHCDIINSSQTVQSFTMFLCLWIGCSAVHVCFC